jgi:hypothetical protein
MWQRERDDFKRLPPKVLRQFRGRFVALHRGKIVDADADPSVLFARVARRLEQKVFFIGRVGKPEPVVDMPGFSLE